MLSTHGWPVHLAGGGLTPAQIAYFVLNGAQASPMRPYLRRDSAGLMVPLTPGTPWNSNFNGVANVNHGHVAVQQFIPLPSPVKLPNPDEDSAVGVDMEDSDAATVPLPVDAHYNPPVIGSLSTQGQQQDTDGKAEKQDGDDTITPPGLNQEVDDSSPDARRKRIQELSDALQAPSPVKRRPPAGSQGADTSSSSTSPVSRRLLDAFNEAARKPKSPVVLTKPSEDGSFGRLVAASEKRAARKGGRSDDSVKWLAASTDNEVKLNVGPSNRRTSTRVVISIEVTPPADAVSQDTVATGAPVHEKKKRAAPADDASKSKSKGKKRKRTSQLNILQRDLPAQFSASTHDVADHSSDRVVTRSQFRAVKRLKRTPATTGVTN